MKRVSTVIASLFLALTLSDGLLVQSQPMQAAEVKSGAQAKVGQTAPDFTLKDTHGKQQKLSDYKGKFIVLEWINFDCPFVKKHYHSGNMQSLQDKYTPKGVAWLSINTSQKGRSGNYTDDEVNAKLTEWKANPTAYLQDDGAVGRLYGATATPHMFVIDKNFKIIYAGAIDDKDTADAADIKGAKNYVSTTLDAAMQNQPVKISQTQAYGCHVHY